MVKKTTLNPVLKKKAIRYLNLLKNKGFKISKAFIFGSYAKGNPKPYSDIDICLVSDKFGKNIFEEQVKLAEIAHQIDIRFEPHVFHPMDFKDKYYPLAEEVKKYGIEVKYLS